MRSRFLPLTLAGLAALACAPAAVQLPESQPTVTLGPVNLAAGATWGPAPAALPAGAQAVVLDGNPAQPGIFTLRLRLPANYVIPPHSHPAYEHVTMISGVLHIGMGDAVSMANATELRAGDFKVIEPNMHHFAHAATEVVIQLHGMGPFQLTYVKSADDPRNR